MLLTAEVRLIPDTRTRHGDVAFVLFALLQLLDGLFTYVGIVSFGPGIEANPLLAWYVTAFGAATALIGAKLMALGCGAVLYATAMHRTMSALVLCTSSRRGAVGAGFVVLALRTATAFSLVTALSAARSGRTGALRAVG